MDNQIVKKIYKFQEKEYYCALELAIDLIGGKWKPIMLYHLREGAMRSSDLQRSFHGGISNKMFTLTARELEYSGLIERVVYPVVPPKVEYKLTVMGESVLPVILEMGRWAIEIHDNQK